MRRADRAARVTAALPGRSFVLDSHLRYYLLPRGARSRLHRIRSDEVWHFYLGGPLVIVEIGADGEARSTLLGPEAGHALQHVVRAGVWFGAHPAPGTQYSLVGCTVAPGFDFADFEMADRAQLLMRFPRARAAIEQLTEP